MHIYIYIVTLEGIVSLTIGRGRVEVMRVQEPQ